MKLEFTDKVIIINVQILFFSKDKLVLNSDILFMCML